MSNYSVEERKVLNEMGIRDFRNVDKNKLMALYSSLKNVTPEVAGKILDQIKNFANITRETIKDYRDIANKALDHAKGSQEKVIEAKLRELSILEEQLKLPKLKNDEKMNILDRIHIVGQDLQAMDLDHKNFILDFLGIVAKAFVALLGIVVGVIFMNKHDDM